MDARANNRSSWGSQRDLWGAKLFEKKGLRAWRTVPIIHSTGKTTRPHTDMKTTYAVSNTFQMFGDPFRESYSSLAEAEAEAVRMAELIAEGFFPTPNADGRVKIEREEHSGPRLGFADEVAFTAELEEMSEEEGGIDSTQLVVMIKDAAIEIEEEEEEQD